MVTPSALNIEHAAHPRSSFVDANLQGSRFSDVGLQHSSFENAAFTGSVFKNVCFGGVSIEDANFEGARINGVLITDLLRAYQVSRRPE